MLVLGIGQWTLCGAWREIFQSAVGIGRVCVCCVAITSYVCCIMCEPMLGHVAFGFAVAQW